MYWANNTYAQHLPPSLACIWKTTVDDNRENLNCSSISSKPIDITPYKSEPLFFFKAKFNEPSMIYHD
ncbi:hypothetical protein CPB83DRAFT_863084 [Crepidotus variabilis]|uniref:Uncharacterized protein n=1 Tax=Crepidotus variabilis TaxID=179855 RepID=A0A9P6E6C0_9AGAR|nr:hypothetical protein CPB83DRAFT_863084 [Crepidotus variabilis]